MFLHLLADSEASGCTEGPVQAGSYIRSRLVCVQHAPYCPVPLSSCVTCVDDIRLVAQTPSPPPPPIVPARNVMQRLQSLMMIIIHTHIIVGRGRLGMKMN